MLNRASGIRIRSNYRVKNVADGNNNALLFSASIAVVNFCSVSARRSSDAKLQFVNLQFDEVCQDISVVMSTLLISIEMSTLAKSYLN